MQLSNRQIQKQINWTNKCFLHALREHYDSKLSKKQKRMGLADLKMLLIHNELPVNSEKINQIYVRNVLALDSKKLSIIVAAYDNGKQHRHPDTIHAITYELFERAVNSETKEEHG